MAYENEPHERREIDYSPFRRISWGAIFAGFILAFVINLALNLLGLGIGIGTVNPMEQDAVSEGLGIGTIIWYVLSVIISLIIGGWVAARLAGIPDRLSGMLHGLLAWCLFTIFSFYLLTTAVGSAIGVTGRIAGQALSLAGQVAPEVGSAVQQEFDQSGIIQNIKQEAGQLAQGAIRNPEQLDEAMNKIFSEGGDSIGEEDRQALANVIAEQSDMSEEEARETADRWVNQYEQARQEFDQLKQDAEREARVVAEDVTSAISTAAIAAFFGLLLGAIASAIGGVMGRPVEVREATRP